jgi:hypothetical protein
LKFRQFGGFRLWAGIGFPDPAHGRSLHRKRLLQHGAGYLPHRREGTDGRERGQPRADIALKFRRHEIAAIGRGADGKGLGFDGAHAVLVAAPDITVEGGLVLQRQQRAHPRFQGGPRLLQQHMVDHALLFIQRVIDAFDLFIGQNIGAGTFFNLPDPVVIVLAELIESLHEIIECFGYILCARALGFGCRSGKLFGHFKSFVCEMERMIQARSRRAAARRVAASAA